MSNRILVLVTFSLITFFAKAQDPLRFEKEIRAFEKYDSTNKKKRDAVLFIGSSTIRRWDSIAFYFPSKPVLNRGFGGSHTSDALYYVDRLVGDYKPRQVFIYEGDNDIAAGKSVDSVYQQLVNLTSILERKFRKATISFLAVKPSPARWKYVSEIRQLNDRMKAYVAGKKRYQYIDVFTPMLDANGKPDSAFYVADGVHLTSLGYAVWAKAITPYLK